jgi:hypothetical protein
MRRLQREIPLKAIIAGSKEWWYTSKSEMKGLVSLLQLISHMPSNANLVCSFGLDNSSS